MQAATPKTAIVTGASKGIGKATAILLGSGQINVVVNYHQDAAGSKSKSLSKSKRKPEVRVRRPEKAGSQV
jgi:NAD(P)-dependent dehydrogenase (short-subunit alcohol dehydrogenase family)